MAFKGVDLAIYSVFKALGLKIGIHPTIGNRSQNMGGLSARDLMSPSSRPDGDYVENRLAAMAPRTDTVWDEDDTDEYEYTHETEEQTTIVGTKLHGPTFDNNYEEESEEVSLCKLGLGNLRPNTPSVQARQPRMAAPESGADHMDE